MSQNVTMALAESLDKIRLKSKSFPWENKKCYGLWLACVSQYFELAEEYLSSKRDFESFSEGDMETLIHPLFQGNVQSLTLLEDLGNLKNFSKEIPDISDIRMMFCLQDLWLEDSLAGKVAFLWLLEKVMRTHAMDFLLTVNDVHSESCAQFLHLQGHESTIFDVTFERRLSVLPSSIEADLIRSFSLCSSVYIYLLDRISQQHLNQEVAA